MVHTTGTRHTNGIQTYAGKIPIHINKNNNPKDKFTILLSWIDIIKLEFYTVYNDS